MVCHYIGFPMPKQKQTCKKWSCGVCARLQEHEGRSCTICKAPKEKGISLVRLKGDWRCPECGVNNFVKAKIGKNW